MIKGLTTEEKFNIIRPIIGIDDEDSYHMPIIHNNSVNVEDWNKIEIINAKNTANIDLSNKIVTMFLFDKELERYWNHTLKYVPRFQNAFMIATPDFSVYPTMNLNEIQHNVYKNRWIGKTWQNYGCRVLPAVQWAGIDTYDICFSGIQKGSPVIVSTLGCQNHKGDFLSGYRAMCQKIQPQYVVVFGDMIDGMYGTFVNYKYTDSFNTKNKDKQLSLFCNSKMFTIKETV